MNLSSRSSFPGVFFLFFFIALSPFRPFSSNYFYSFKTTTMRSFFLFLLMLPAFEADAQINRSAKELAGERIEEYIVTKLFKSRQYKPVSYSELKSYNDKNSSITWIIAHEFELTEKKLKADGTSTAPVLYKFFFYLDDKMKVVKSEGMYLN
jgi:hypothetical protein